MTKPRQGAPLEQLRHDQVLTVVARMALASEIDSYRCDFTRPEAAAVAAAWDALISTDTVPDRCAGLLTHLRDDGEVKLGHGEMAELLGPLRIAGYATDDVVAYVRERLAAGEGGTETPARQQASVARPTDSHSTTRGQP